MKFLVKLPFFEGPFSLLLFFVEKQEVDIHKISISAIVRDFLDYIARARALNVTLAGDFILVAAKLMRIKASRLLPPVEQEVAEEDTKEHLIACLQAYKKYKRAALLFADMQEQRSHAPRRGNLSGELAQCASAYNTSLEMEAVTVGRMVNAYLRAHRRCHERKSAPTTHLVRVRSHTVDKQKDYIIRTLRADRRLHFRDLLAMRKGRTFIVYSLLAMLDLAHAQKITLHGGATVNDFWVTLRKTPQTS